MSTWTTDDGTDINFETFGDRTKSPLLLLPGLLGSMNTQWRSFIRGLTGDYWVILMDLRGHGRSGNQANDLMPNRMAQDIAGLLDTLEIVSVHIAGYSLGGYLGLLLALNQPRRVKTLLMHGTKFYWTEESAAKMREQLQPDIMTEKVPTYVDQLMQEHGARHWRILVRQASDLVTFLVTKGITEGMIKRVQCPVLVSLGDRDEMVPLPEAARLSRILPSGELLVLPGVRHSFQTIRPIPLLPMMLHFHHSDYRSGK